MAKNEQSPTGMNPAEQGLAESEKEHDRYEQLALEIIRETAKLERRLDVYDVPLLAKIIKDALRGVEADRVAGNFTLHDRGKNG